MNAARSSIVAGGTVAAVLALVSCAGPEEENLRVVPLTAPMTSYNPSPHTRVVVAGLDYTEVHDEWMDRDLMKKASSGNARVVISRGSQRGQLMVGDQVAMDFPVCLGKASHRTPLGKFHITEKKVHHVSNLYDASMPYFMRLTDGGIGMHVGPVFRTPQSHGCIRLTRSSCVPLFKTVKVGTPVTIVQ